LPLLILFDSGTLRERLQAASKHYIGHRDDLRLASLPRAVDE
jgi:hypothetical protein